MIAGLLGLTAVSVLGLRLVTRHHSTPCPHWLAPLLENPYMNAVAGSGVILERARVQPGMAVLDVGAGPGRLSVPAALRVGPMGRVVAFDIQSEMLARLHQAKTAAGVTNLETVLGEAGQGSLPSGPFDRVLLVTVLGEIADQRGALAEIFKRLKPGGLLSVTEVLPDPHYQSRTRVRRLAEGAGFEVADVQGSWYAFTMNLRKPVADRARGRSQDSA